MESPERGKMAHRHILAQGQGVLLFFFFAVQEQVCSLRSPLPIPKAFGIWRISMLHLLTPKSCYPSGESIPFPPNLLLPLFGNSTNLQKAEEAKRKDNPARLCLEFQMTKSKTQKENQVFY